MFPFYPSPLPHPPVPLSGSSLPVAPCRFSPFDKGVQVCLRPVRSLSPLCPHTSGSSLPLCNCTASFISPSLSHICVLPVSSDDRPIGYGALHWHTAPDIGRTCRCERPCGTCIARSYMPTSARICTRPRRQDELIMLVPWCEPPAPSSPPSPLFPP